MITISVNERSRAGKALLETAKVLAEKNTGIAFLKEENDETLLKKMLAARKSGTTRKVDILDSLEVMIKK